MDELEHIQGQSFPTFWTPETDMSIADRFSDWLYYKVVAKTNAIKYSVISVSEFSRWLMGRNNFAIKNDWGYIWNESYWERVSVKQIHAAIDMEIINIADRLGLAATKKRELQKDVKTYIVQHSRNFDDTPKPNYIAFKNWTLNVKEKNFFPPKKQMNVIGGFDFEPDPNQAPTTWIAYANYMFGENAKWIWAWLGYSSQPAMDWKQGALFLLDPIGGTGKTHFVTKITHAMFGENRVGAFKLKNLQGNNARFETARFVDKVVMIDDDATRVRFKEDDVFKAVTGGGLSPVERKGVDGTEAKITAKMIINVNEMPVFNNSSAITRRLHIVKTEAPVADADEIAKRDLFFPPEELDKERPRLLPYAIEMYQQAVAENWQIVGNIADDIVAVDPFVSWIKSVPKGEYSASDLYDMYSLHYIGIYGENNPQNQPMSMQSFGRKMANWATKKVRRDGRFYVVN